MYSKKEGQWIKNDEVNGLDNNIIAQFDYHFQDYDFDGQKDIFLQCTASNGYCLSRGHLLTIDPATKKMKTHPEARDLCNMSPSSGVRTVISEDVIWCEENGNREVCKWKNKWVNGRLKTQKKDCPCVPMK